MFLHATSVRVAVSGLALVVLLASCAGIADHDGGGTHALLFERKQKTYDLALERVYDAVHAYLVSEGGNITAGSRDELSLEAVLPGSAVSGSAVPGELRYEVGFELVVEGVTVRVQVYESETGSPVERAGLYERFFAGVEENL
ncbi:MAG: hypothetical protein GVY14_04285 [Spirochaetes bacterium]|nr:hypothetical protein [Spirochaetota bacterium]